MKLDIARRSVQKIAGSSMSQSQRRTFRKEHPLCKNWLLSPSHHVPLLLEAKLDHDRYSSGGHACMLVPMCSPIFTTPNLKYAHRNFNSPVCLPNRSYYRCTNPRCNAKKQVERSTDDPEMLIITYEGLHLHYAYSHFFLPRRQGNSATSLHVPKKPKLQQQVEDLDQNPDVRPTKPEAPTTQQQQQQLEIIRDQKSPRGRLLGDAPPPSPVLGEERMPTEDGAQCPQGLLEDIVPLLVRNPCNSTSSQASSPDHYSSSHSSPPKSAHHLDVGELSNMI